MNYIQQKIINLFFSIDDNTNTQSWIGAFLFIIGLIATLGKIKAINFIPKWFFIVLTILGILIFISASISFKKAKNVKRSINQRILPADFVRPLFFEDDKELDLSFYGIKIFVPLAWNVKDAWYSNRIDLVSKLGYICIWFKKYSDNDQIIFDKLDRLEKCKNRLAGKRVSKIDYSRQLKQNENIIYLEYYDDDKNPNGKCCWFSMVYSEYEINISLISGNIDDSSVRNDFEQLIEAMQFC